MRPFKALTSPSGTCATTWSYGRTGIRAGGSGAITRRIPVGGIIYLVGLVVVILAILSFLGLR